MARRRIGEAEADVVAIKGRNEGEAIRAIGLAKAEAYKQGVEAMGGNYAVLQIFQALADKNIRLTPDVMVTGGGATSSDGMLAVVLRDLLQKANPTAKT